MMFSDWLLSQLAKRDWKQSDLAKKSGLTKQTITNYANGRIPDKTAISKIAAAFKIPAEEVYRVAIGRPQNPDSDPWVEETSYKLNLVPPSLRGIVDSFIDSMVESSENNHKTRSKTKPKSSTS